MLCCACCVCSASRVWPFATPWTLAHQDLCPLDSPCNTRVACHAFCQGFFPTQGLNPGLQHCKRILYHLSHQGSPEYWSGYPILGDLPDPGIQLGPPALQVDSSPAELFGKPLRSSNHLLLVGNLWEGAIET